MHDRPGPAEQIAPGVRPIRLVLVVLALLLVVSFASNWYAEQVSLRRYCQQPKLVLQRLAAIMAENGLTGHETRRDYVVAAKLEFLVPPAADEPLDAYLSRVRRQLERQCR